MPTQELLFETAPLSVLWGEPAGPAPKPRPAAIAPEVKTAWATPPCLNCGKPSRRLTPGRPPVFCSNRCKAAWSSSMTTWSSRYAAACDQADREAGTDRPELF